MQVHCSTMSDSEFEFNVQVQISLGILKASSTFETFFSVCPAGFVHSSGI